MSADAHAASHDHGDDHGHGHGGPEHHPHVLPLRAYFGVWSALLALTAITVFVSYFDFGEANLVVALLVATIKAILVAAIFMHLRYDAKFNVIVLASSVVFLAIFIGLTSLDTQHRGAADEARGVRPADSRHPWDPPQPKPEVKAAPHGEHGHH